jgi:hypothetical protein
MPTLNRIRLANVAYDGKYIIDQTFDTYGGENTLFNLANGGGKSVLVQMIMQPVLPCQRIHDRRADNYLSQTAHPSYIMLEWKLDHTVKPLYFLTGIAMCSIAQNDESGSRVKYFTFTHKYDVATDFDIAHTPLIEPLPGGGYRYMPYDEAFSLLKNVKNELYPLHCFARDRKESYQKELEEHGIFPEEWKLLARINDKEGGVDEVFAACKSSDALLERWILKTIADKSKEEEQNLREMFMALMSSVLAQEETVAEKELLTEFLAEISQLIDKLANLSQYLDALEQAERLLSGLYRYIEGRLNDIEEEKQNCATASNELNEAKQQIRYEQVSETWHRANEIYLKQSSRFEEQSAITEAQRCLYDKAKRDKETMEAAAQQERLARALANISTLRAQLDRIKSGPSEEDAPDVLYSLNMRYTETIAQNRGALQKILEDLDRLELLRTQYKDEVQNIDSEKQAIAGKLGTLAQKIAAFASYEAACQKALDITIRRTLFNELNADETETAQKLLSGRLELLLQQGGELEQQIKTSWHRRQELRDSHNKLTYDLVEAKEQISKQEIVLEQYEKHEKSLCEITERRALAKHINDIPNNISLLKESEIQRRTELTQWDAQYVHQRDMLARLDANSLHTAAEFGQMLESKGISYITGENYLKEMDEKKQQAVLNNNPMLPFCFLVGRSDFAVATSLCSEGIDRICPVLILEKAEENIKAGERGVSLTDNGLAICYYYEESFAPATKGLFRDKLETALAQTEKSRAEWRAELESIKQDIKFLEDFPYHEQSRQLLTGELEALKTASQQISARIEAETREARELEESYQIAQNERTANKITQEQALRNISLMEEYLTKNISYMQDFTEHQSLTQKQEELKKQFQKLNNDIEGCTNKTTGLCVEKAAKSKLIEVLEEKQRQLNPPLSGEMLDWPLEALERRYAEIKSKQSRDEQLIQTEIAYHKEKQQEAERALKKYRHIKECELENIIYSQSQLETLEKEEKRHKQLLLEAEKEQEKAKMAHITAKAERDSCENRLQEEGWHEALAPTEISGDYDARRNQISQKLTALNRKIVELSQEREKCQQDINRILRIIENPAPVEMEAPEGGWQRVDIARQTIEHKSLQGKITALRNEADELERTIKNTYQGQHAGIDHITGHLSVSSGAQNYEACYFVFERLSEQYRILQETVRVLESHLAHLDNQKANVIYHAFAQGKRLHAELRKISESSRVKLLPGKPRQPTLKIGVPDELDPLAEERVRNHVNACIAEMRRLKKETALTEKTMRAMIDTKLSDREILNQVIGQHTIDVRLLKVDISRANSKLRTWESVLTDNSGGELFVSCFVLLSALMAYSRQSILPNDSSGGMKVMLIDNPFGKTSSEHLLDALIQVAGQFKMQMICLSDLSQSSITAKFALIYQLSLRPSMHSGKAYLSVDSLANNAPLTKDNRLDHVSLKHEQISIF